MLSHLPKQSLALAAALLLSTAAQSRVISIPFDADNFTNPKANSYFPLNVGMTQVYKAETKDGCEVDVVTVTDQTRVIAGVTTRVVHDTAYEGDTCTTDPSALVEDTLDYFAEDNDGSVWYFGEDTFHCPIFTCPPANGAWLAGENGAVAGIVMLTDPRSGDTYFQEQAAPVALDQATVTSVGVKVTLTRDDAFPPGTFSNCIKTKEFTTLEKGSIEQKTYCPNVGLVTVEEHHGSILRFELTGGADPLKFRTVPKQ